MFLAYPNNSFCSYLCSTVFHLSDRYYVYLEWIIILTALNSVLSWYLVEVWTSRSCWSFPIWFWFLKKSCLEFKHMLFLFLNMNLFKDLTNFLCPSLSFSINEFGLFCFTCSLVFGFPIIQQQIYMYICSIHIYMLLSPTWDMDNACLSKFHRKLYLILQFNCFSASYNQIVTWAYRSLMQYFLSFEGLVNCSNQLGIG